MTLVSRVVIVVAVGALAVMALGAGALVTGVFENLARRGGTISTQPAATAATRPAQDYRRIREEESKVLREYQWIDRDAGIARIPVERAMKLIIERGSLTPTPADTAQ